MIKPFIAANWKMHMTSAETEAYIKTFLLEITDISDTEVDIVLAPPFTSLPKASELLSNQSKIRLGAQNVSEHRSGPYTGEISATMLREFFVRYVIIGHSERRQYFGETDAWINKKMRAAHDSSLRPIFCLGETLEERDRGQVESVLGRQLREGLAGFKENEIQNTVIAYEPIWAIGTGRTATPEQAEEAHAFLRSELSKLVDPQIANRVRILYGGSVKPDNTEALLSQPNINGALVGGASLDPRQFLEIVRLGVTVARGA